MLKARAPSKKLKSAPDNGGILRLPPTISRAGYLVGGTDLEFRQFVHDLFAFTSRAHEIRSQLAKQIDLSNTQYAVLTAAAYLARTEVQFGINELASHLHLSGAFVTTVVNKLVMSGLMTKRPNPDDRRRVILTLTSEAHKRLETVFEILCPTNDTLFENISEKEFFILKDITQRLAASGDRALKLVEFLTRSPRR